MKGHGDGSYDSLDYAMPSEIQGLYIWLVCSPKHLLHHGSPIKMVELICRPKELYFDTTTQLYLSVGLKVRIVARSNELINYGSGIFLNITFQLQPDADTFIPVKDYGWHYMINSEVKRRRETIFCQSVRRLLAQKNLIDLNHFVCLNSFDNWETFLPIYCFQKTIAIQHLYFWKLWLEFTEQYWSQGSNCVLV